MIKKLKNASTVKRLLLYWILLHYWINKYNTSNPAKLKMERRKMVTETLRLFLSHLVLLINHHHQKIKCKVLGCKCKKLIRLLQMRLHVGWHIIHGLAADPHRCGYCGQICCNVSLVKTSGIGESAIYGPESDCEYHYKFSTKKSSTEEAKKIPASYPCLPVKCQHCEHIYWSYNMEAHY